MISNISLEQQISTYKELMGSLIYEKPTMTSEKKAQKEAALSKLAREKFVIDGDNDFKTEIDEHINNVLSVKPGRKLIKALLKSDQQISIVKGDMFQHRSSRITVHFPAPNYITNYTTIGNRSICRPAWVIFAHELIHALHNEKSSVGYASKVFNRKNLIERMDNMEEQHTIVGFDECTYSKIGIKNKLDVLCENAFLFALGLPPRIDHRGGVDEDLARDTQKGNYSLGSYCAWLENTLRSIRQIPVEKSDDKEFIFEFINQNPIAASTLSEKLKNDEEFMLELISNNVRLVKKFPELHQNQGFMLKLIDKHDVAMVYLTPELLNKKAFVIKCLELACGDEMLLEIIYKKIEVSLKEDPDIKRYYEV